MKVVIFCGGLGVRMGEATQRIPKPMIAIGTQPILWHLMKWYASWGHTEFILCLGHRAEGRQGLLPRVQRGACQRLRAVERRTRRGAPRLGTSPTGGSPSWTPGVQSSIGERLRRVGPHLGDDAYFLATYGDGVTDAPLDEMIATLERAADGTLHLGEATTGVPPRAVGRRRGGDRRIELLAQADVRINGGLFVFRREILDAIEPGEELVEQPFARLIERGELLAYPYDGFWEPMDTIKDKQRLDALFESGRPPWRRGLPPKADARFALEALPARSSGFSRSAVMRTTSRSAAGER